MLQQHDVKREGKAGTKADHEPIWTSISLVCPHPYSRQPGSSDSHSPIVLDSRCSCDSGPCLSLSWFPGTSSRHSSLLLIPTHSKSSLPVLLSTSQPFLCPVLLLHDLERLGVWNPEHGASGRSGICKHLSWHTPSIFRQWERWVRLWPLRASDFKKKPLAVAVATPQRSALHN